MRLRGLSLLMVCLIWIPNARAQRDRGSWKRTLHDKAAFFEKHAKERHNIVGSYPSSVRLLPPKHYAGSQEGAWKRIVETGELPPGWVVNHGTTGISNVAHTSSWTGCLLTAEAFRVAFVRKRYGVDSPQYKEAYARADEVIGSLRILTLVSGQPGYLARGVALGHGISYEERGNSDTRDLWAQGAGEFSHLRYRGGPSHHNYDQVFRGLGIYYFVAADDRQKEKIRQIVADMSNWAHLAHNMVVMHVDGKRESTVLIGGWRGLGGDDRPSGGSLMALTGLKIAHKITGNEKVGRLYREWVERLGFRDPERRKASIMGGPRTNYDDTDHLLADLYLLNLIEDDPDLHAYYKKCVKDSWEAHKPDKMAWFNYVYRAVLGDEYGDAEGSLWNLRTHPTCRVFQPQMNSIRTDIEFHGGPRGKEALHPLPGYERPSDNEYEWKGSPYELDRWLSRIVTVLDISPHDPYVQFAADASGGAYWSNTKGEVWHDMEVPGRVQDYLFAPDYPWLAFAATTDGIHATRNGGESWSRVFDQATETLQVDPWNARVLYGTGPGGVFRSPDLGEQGMGRSWRPIGGAVPPGTSAVFAVDPRPQPARLYMLARQGFYAKDAGAPEWSPLSKAVRKQGFSEVDPIGGEPMWLRVDPRVQGRVFRAVRTREWRFSGLLISVSDDGGATWSPVIRALKPLADWAAGTWKTEAMPREELMRLFAVHRELNMLDFRVDRHDPQTWYGRLADSVAITHDAGENWHVSAKGMDIPRVEAIWTPRHGKQIVAGTPAGMYVSNDRGETWRDTPLILQGGGAIRSEIGGIGFLTAYWLGRYHDFIAEREAHAEWWNDE